MSLTYNRNKRGPRAEPWGTPHCVIRLSETKLSTAVVCLRSNKYERSQSFTIPRIPQKCSLLRRIEWSTVSNAFFKSIKIPQVYLLLFLFLCITLRMSRFACCVLWPPLKQN